MSVREVVKVRRQGSSLAISLPRTILEAAGLLENDQVILSTGIDGTIRIHRLADIPLEDNRPLVEGIG